MTQHSCQIDDRGSSLLSYCPTRKSGSQRSHHCEPGSFRTFFISESFQGLSPKVSPKLNTLSPPKSPPRFWASPPTFLESQEIFNLLLSFANIYSNRIEVLVKSCFSILNDVVLFIKCCTLHKKTRIVLFYFQLPEYFRIFNFMH